jgi:hypothetical protein
LSNLLKCARLPVCQYDAMRDVLISRATRAIDDSRLLREQRRLLMERHDQILADLRLAIMDSAMVRTEIRAHRDNQDN